MLFCSSVWGTAFKSGVSSPLKHQLVQLLLTGNQVWGEDAELEKRYRTNSTEKTTPEKAAGSLARIPSYLGHT